MTEKEKMLAGQLYRFGGAELTQDALRAEALTRAYNATGGTAEAERRAILSELLGAVGEQVVLRPPFYCDYGYNIRIGANTFINFGCVFLDVAPIVIGAHCQFAPYVQLCPPDHPRDPAMRRAGYESGRAISIGDNAWLGAGAIVLPGITIGEDTIIGAGSVVTRDVPAGARVVGNPARILP